MQALELSPQAIDEVKAFFPLIRQHLQGYMQERDFVMSNAQIFIFLTYIPTALAISADKQVDQQEMRILDKIAKSIDANALDLNLVELLSFAPEPVNVMLNEEFNLRIGAELLHIARDMERYEKDFIEAVKLLLKFDKNPDADTSMTKTFSNFMDQIVKNSLAINKDREMEKITAYKKKLGII